jgi:hypothetical protein
MCRWTACSTQTIPVRDLAGYGPIQPGIARHLDRQQRPEMVATVTAPTTTIVAAIRSGAASTTSSPS